MCGCSVLRWWVSPHPSAVEKLNALAHDPIQNSAKQEAPTISANEVSEMDRKRLVGGGGGPLGAVTLYPRTSNWPALTILIVVN
jgi:hypothetical protein